MLFIINNDVLMRCCIEYRVLLLDQIGFVLRREWHYSRYLG